MSNIDTYGARAYAFGHHGLRRVWSAVLRAARKGDVGRYPIIDDGEAKGVTVAGSSGQSEGADSRWAVILEATTDFVGMADVHGGVLYVNRAGREMVGAGEDEDLSGTTIAAYHPRWASGR
jgi:PAS domain-containing protein